METRIRTKYTYLGDSVYLDKWGNGYRIYTDNGLGPTNEIFLEDLVVNALLRAINKDEMIMKSPGETITTEDANNAIAED